MQKQQRPRSTVGDDATTVLGRVGKVLVALGGGTGVVMQETVLPGDYESRSRYQNDALLVLIATAYFVAIFLGLSYLRWRVENRSPITFYADPTHTATAMEGHDVVSFLATFNQAPKQVLLQVTGFLPVDNDGAHGSIEWEEERFRVAFTFALDLSPWLVREEWADGADCCSAETSEDSGATRQPLLDGIVPEELESLRQFLSLDNNDLATVLLYKEVAWPGWEELATNIRQRIKQCGFPGVLSIQCGQGETVTVHKNRPWANFLHNRATGVLCMLSAVGWPVYHVYMWVRCTQVPIHARFRVDIATADYWPFIADKLSASGFDVTAGSTGGSA